MAENKNQARPGGPGHGPGRGHGYQRPQNLRGTVGKLLAYIGRYKAALIVVAVCLVLSSVGSVASSYFLKPALNHIVAGDFKGLFWMLVAMGGVFLVSAGCSYAYSRIMVRISQRTVATLRQDLFNKLQSLPLRYFDTHQSGDLMSRFTNDMDTVSDMISNSFASVVSNLLTFVCTVVMLVYLNWALTLITFVFLGLMLLVVKGVGGRSRTSFQQQQAALGSLNGYIEEMIEGQKVIKVFHHEQKTLDEFSARNSAYRDAAAMAQTYAGAMMPAMGNLSRINYAVTCCVGGLLSISGVFDIGSLGAYLLYVKQVSQPVGQISQQVNTLLAAVAGAERIFAVMDADPETDEGRTTLVRVLKDGDSLTETDRRTGHWAWKKPDGSLTELRGDVRFEHVDFGYDPEKTVLHDVSLFAEPGQKIAFVGSTGAGKTTITNLINRFYDIADGKIRYDGINIHKIKKADLRRYRKLVEAVKKVYPVAQAAKAQMVQMEAELLRLETKKEQKQYIKGIAAAIKKEYTPVLKHMTRTQGRVLLKLIDRETKYTAYEILREFRGGFVAGFWQSVSRIFGQNLKSEYDREGDDKVLEQIVLYYEAGLL